MEKKWNATWILDPRFRNLKPINLFHKELVDTIIPPHPEELQNQHMLVRKAFSLDKGFSKARLDITADDYYILYINNKKVGQGPAPSYFFHYNYNQYDVSEYLHRGDNVIAVDVYYQGLINRVWNSGDYRQGMIAELLLDDERFLGTDASWKFKNNAACKRGQITSLHNTQFLEYIDSRLFPCGWMQLDFDDTDWKAVAENKSDDHELYLQITPTKQNYFCRPISIHQIGKGHYLADFGEEITGTFTTFAKGQAGECIEILYGEELDETGEHVRFQLRCNCLYKDLWILSGEEDKIEFFDYKSFRYVEITGPEEALHPEHFAVVAEHYPFDETNTTLRCDHDLLNNIWSICKRTIKNGAQETFVDCPTREKGQYLGDVMIAANSHLYLTGDSRLLKKAIMDFALSSRICPGLMAVAPGNLMQEIADYSLQWPSLLLMYYQHTGDRLFLKEMLPVAENMLAYFKRYRREDGLIEKVTDKWNLVDWPQNTRDDYDFDLAKPVGPGVHNVLNAFYLGAIKTVNQIKDILDIEYENDLPDLIRTFQKVFYNDAVGLYIDAEGSSHMSEHSNILPLYFNFIGEKEAGPIIQFLKTKRFSCSVYMAYFLLKALARFKEYDFVFELLTCTDKQSWANMISEGATTCFEAWGKDQKWNTSLCHPWATSPISVIIEDLAGLRPIAGWKNLSFEPHIPSSIKILDLEVGTAYGKIIMIVRDGRIEIHTPAEIRIEKRQGKSAAGSKRSMVLD